MPAPTIPALSRRSSCVPASLYPPLSEESLAEFDTARQHRTFHLLIKPDILTCYQQRGTERALDRRIRPFSMRSFFRRVFLSRLRPISIVSAFF